MQLFNTQVYDTTETITCFGYNYLPDACNYNKCTLTVIYFTCVLCYLFMPLDVNHSTPHATNLSLVFDD